jgi:predicted AlkP superfamily pyrophosphatase or phosphodiesterase
MKRSSWLRYVIVLVVTGGLIYSCSPSQVNSSKTAKKDVYVVMLSMDGFRWDYAQRAPTPNLDKLAGQGVMAEYVIPAFPSKTFPNHYSMATGLYPGSHGIVANNFYCPDLDLTYRLGDRQSVENGDFYKGEPIWVTAEKQGIRAASFFWVGSEAPVKGIQPTYWKQYQHDFPFGQRIDTVITWLSLPLEKRPRLVTLYFDQPDSQGHRTGPDSYEVDRQVMYLDSLVGVLYNKLSELPIAHEINFIVTSDHGMTELSPDRYTDLSLHVQRDWFKRIHGGDPLYSFRPKAEMADSVYKIFSRMENVSVWKADDIPARFNYNHPRVLDMIVLADTAWSIGWGEPRSSYYGGGGHGWDNLQMDMRTIFYATGPAFRQGHIQQPFQVVDLYPLITHIMGLKPAEVDGDLQRVRHMLK